MFLGCLPYLATQYHVTNVPKLVDEVFKEFAQGKECMSPADMVSFAEKYQGDSVTEDEAQALLTKFKETSPEHDSFFTSIEEESLSDAGLDLTEFTKLLLNPNLNDTLKPKQMIQDMTAPLSQYYVHTSHNSYLTGNQLWSRSSTTPIITALHNGCRVIELDCWDKRGKIKVLHGGTLTSSVSFEDCVTAIKEHAFKASSYPVIITIENHLGPALQIQAVKILKEILGDSLYIPDPQHDGLDFLSPEALKEKIIISDRPSSEPVADQIMEDQEGAHAIEFLGTGDESPDLNPKSRKRIPTGIKLNTDTVLKGARKYDEATATPEIPKADEFDELLYIHCQKTSEMEEGHVEGGPLVSGEKAIMANLSEPQLKTFIKSHPGSIIEYTKKNLGRVYPYGLRFDSSNADPMWAWSHGCQMAALNLQGRDRAAWLAEAFFYSNGGCGYVKKPDVFLREDILEYDQILNLPPKLLLKVKVLLGTDWHKRFDLFKHPDFYVMVSVKGIPTDTLRKRTKVAFQTKEPSWEDEEFEFPMRVPEIAVLRIEVWEHDRFLPDDFVGQSCMPVCQLRQGIRVIPLHSKKGEVLSSKLLFSIKLEDLEVPVGSDTS